MTLRQGIKMQGQDLNEYIAKFEELIQHAQYDINGLQCYVLTKRLPDLGRKVPVVTWS